VVRASFTCECCVLSEVSVLGWSPVQRISNKCGVSECDREASIMRRPRSAGGCCLVEERKKKHFLFMYFIFPFAVVLQPKLGLGPFF